MLLCWNTDMNVVVYSTSVAACADRPTTSTRHRLDSTVHPSMSSGLNQNAPAASRRSALWCIWRSEEHTSELQSLMRISYAVFCLKKKKKSRAHIKPT